MIPEMSEHINQLRQMTTAQLRLKYHELFAYPSHSNHKGYLFRRLAWRLQSLAEGDLSERARQYARQITEDADLRLCAPRNFVSSQPAMRVANTSRQSERALIDHRRSAGAVRLYVDGEHGGGLRSEPRLSFAGR